MSASVTLLYNPVNVDLLLFFFSFLSLSSIKVALVALFIIFSSLLGFSVANLALLIIIAASFVGIPFIKLYPSGVSIKLAASKRLNPSTSALSFKSAILKPSKLNKAGSTFLSAAGISNDVELLTLLFESNVFK